MKISRIATLTIAGVAFVWLPSAPAAHAATTGPVIKMNPFVSFTTGQSIWLNTVYSSTGFPVYNIPVHFSWSATATSGICGYDLSVDNEGGTSQIWANQHITSYNDTIDNYNGIFGQSNPGPYDWKITAHDCTGNTTTATIWAFPFSITEQDNSRNWGTAGAEGTFAYTGTWSKSNCTCATNGTQTYSTKSGASADFLRTYIRGDNTGIVMAEGPGRGRAKIYVDGKLRTTIDTFAQVNTNMVVVFSTWLPAGSHDIKVVNLATQGRSRIDVDAALSN